jgi:hypothetical protein
MREAMNLRIAREHWKWPAFALCIAAGIAALGPDEEIAVVQAAATPVLVRTSSADLPAALPRRQTLAKLGADPFAPRSWTPPAASTVVHAAPVEAAPIQPAAPPNPYRFAGNVQHGGTIKVVLAAGERIHVVKRGDVIDDLYRVDAVSRNAATLVYLPLGLEHQLAYTPEAVPSSAVPSGPLAGNLPPGRP